MDCELSASEKRQYDAWMHSPSVFSSILEETILAFKIARILHQPPSKTLKALRGIAEVDTTMREDVESYVNDNPALGFENSPPKRLIVLTQST